MKRSTFPFFVFAHRPFSVRSSFVHHWLIVHWIAFTIQRALAFTVHKGYWHSVNVHKMFMVCSSFSKRQPFSFGTPTWKDCSKQWQSKEGTCAEGWEKKVLRISEISLLLQSVRTIISENSNENGLLPIRNFINLHKSNISLWSIRYRVLGFFSEKKV